jgi:hypothetical protein
VLLGCVVVVRWSTRVEVLPPRPMAFFRPGVDQCLRKHTHNRALATQALKKSLHLTSAPNPSC